MLTFFVVLFCSSQSMIILLMLLSHSFIHQTFIHLAYVRDCAVEAPETNNTQCMTLKGRAMGRGCGYSLHLCVSMRLPSLWGTLGHAPWPPLEEDLCPGVSLWSPVDVVGECPRQLWLLQFVCFPFKIFWGLHVSLWIIICPQMNMLITFRFLLIFYLI